MNLLPQIRSRSKAAVALFALMGASVASYAIDPAVQPDLDRGFQQMYNLDFPAAHATFGTYQ